MSSITRTSRPKGFGKTTTGDYHRPRRPSAETIRYLKSLPLELDTALAEIRAHAADPTLVEFPSSLAAALSALDEIGNEIASLAGDEHASQALELLVRLTAPFSVAAARKLVTACAGYAVFLATHRYGSHVLQTILQLAVGADQDVGQDNDLALHADAPELSGMDDLPSLTQAVLVLHAELLPHVSSLAVHVCGSHILRTLSCILGGYQQRQQQQHNRRGGKSKAKQVERLPTDPRLVAMAHTRLDPHDSAVATALEELVTAVSGSEVQPPGTLQELACDSSASPLLMVMLRVLTYRDADALSNNQDKNDNLPANTTTETKPTVGINPDHHLVRIPVEPHFREGSAAEALAHRLVCWQPKKGDSAQSHAGDVIYGLAGEPRGSHVLDTLFRLAPNAWYNSLLQAGDFLAPQSLTEYIQHDVSNFVMQTILATLRTQEQALKISNALQSNATLIFDPEKRRRGILWRWAEMAVTFPECQAKVIQAITSALTSLQNNSKLSKHCASSLLGIQDSPSDSDRLVLNVEGTRALFHLLHFEGEASKGVAESVLALSTTELERLAKDGLGSRCVWDAIIEEGSPVSFLRKKLLAKLQGRWVALATDRVGHHVVRKLFTTLPEMKSRESLVKELSSNLVRLEGNAMGRKIASHCHVREYTTKGETEWERSVGKTIKEKQWLQDMLQSEPKVKSKDCKRVAPNEDATQKSKRIKEMSMGDIVSAISMPKKQK